MCFCTQFGNTFLDNCRFAQIYEIHFVLIDIDTNYFMSKFCQTRSTYTTYVA